MSAPCPARRRVGAGLAPLATLGLATMGLAVTGLAVAGLTVVLLAAPASAASRDARCTRLEARIENLRLRLRMGYVEPQGRRWRQQLRGLEAERRATCR